MNGRTLGSVAFLLTISLLSFMACDRSSVPDDSGSGTREFDPASSDLPNFNSANPPRLSETFFEIEGVGMNAIVGHSMGGFAALIAGAELPEVDCIVSMAGANLGGLARSLENMPEQSAAFAASLDSWSSPINGASGEQLIEELVAQAERFDTTERASVLAGKALLLIAAGRDVVAPPAVHHVPLVEALEAADARSLETTIFEQADHAFSGQRIALARLVTRWLQTKCTQGD